jgi:lipid A disaccharide synthetase
LVTELIQNDCTPEKLEYEFKRLLPGEVHRQEVEKGYREIQEILGQGGASAKVAHFLLKTI